MRKTAAIIGGGVIGGGWAARFLLNGWDVRLFDPDPEAERKLGEVMANARRALPMLYDVALPEPGQLAHVATISDAVAGADWVQESVPERLELKHKVYAEIAAAAPGALIGSSTSGFKPSDLRSGPEATDRLFVAHPFNPVYLLPLVELVGAPGEAAEALREIGMYPLEIKAEIEAHIADRLLEAVWRESLWLVRDGIATTQEIDDAIRYGFGLRWAQMGLFETYRIAGGEAGMRHFLAQFGPALAWPWTKLTDVPDLTEDLVARIAEQSDTQSGQRSIRALERRRDDNLVAILRALRQQDAAAGRLLNRHQNTLPRRASTRPGPILTVDRTVPVDWTDYNGHMNESRFGQAFSDAADALMAAIGADADYVARGLSFFTVDIRIRFLREAHAGDPILVESQLLESTGKKLRLFHRMQSADGAELATAEQLLIHVNLETRRACNPASEVEARIAALAADHASLPQPDPSERL